MNRSLVAAATVLTVLLGVTATSPAVAAVQQALGESTSPAQQYLLNSDASDWLGSYLVNGEQAWSVQFAAHKPDEAETYLAPSALQTKWGTALPADVAADIAHLLWRYGATDVPEDAAALAHLLQSWTSGPQNPGQLDPSNDFRHIAYDAPAHLMKLSVAARTRVTEMSAEAAALRGPWTVSIVAPSGATVGAVADWEIRVANAAGDPLPSVAVTLSVTDGTLAGGATSLSFTTPSDGAPLIVPVVAAGTSPTVTVDAVVPLEAAVGMQAVAVDVSRVVTRSANIATVSASVTGSAAAVPSTSSPALPDTGETPPWLAVIVAALIAFTGVLLVALSRRARGERMS